MEIAKYTIGTSIVFPKSEMTRFDSQLKILENKMKASGERMRQFFNLNLTKFSVNQTAMNRVIGAALDIASQSTVFRIERFVVDQSRLNAALGSAMARTNTVANIRQNGAPVGTRRAAAVGGLIGGGLSRFYGPALALGLGGYGLGALNKRNQEVVSAQLQSSAVVQQAGGTAAQGSESFQYLRSEGQRIGFNYLDASGDYNKLISGLTGSGISVKESQKVFSGFAELARVNKLDKTTQNRLFRALSQVAGKGKLMSEELTGQIAEALPGGTALFAQAYQAKLGGNKTGADAIQQLLDDMKKGKVKSDILTFAGTEASQRANQGGALGAASQASQAEQARYQNQVNDMAVLASNSGVEEGFARIFRTLNAGLSESGGLVRTLSEGFNEATKWADDLLLFPQSFIRALEGKDSMVADWLGIGQTSQLVKDWQDIKTLWDQMSALNPSNLFGQFLPTIEATTRELAMILNQLAEFQRWKNNLVVSPSQEQDVSFWQRPITATYQTLGKFFSGADDAIDRSKDRGRAVYDDPNSYFYQNPALYDENQKNMAMDQANAANDYQLNAAGSVTNQFDININVDAATLDNIDIKSQAQELADMFRIELSNASVNFPVKE